ncbi:unnamed protein product [Cyprideis torosa]|uniref:Uncharacterized protein n=1 Tax=Cyprideis torosa TaxID=163714 RepID=A0A7R8WF77_9CRUS|nr:unnamed protein product [Cyprideis torosa]CAG0896698.1 unnamed protein product [Cyprideis torosa]
MSGQVLLEDATTSEGKRFSCSTCGKAYTAKSSLLRHEVVHDVSKFEPRDCRRCGQTFENYEAFEKHDIIHRPFRCQLCGRGFTAKSSLVRHAGLVHGEVKDVTLVFAFRNEDPLTSEGEKLSTYPEEQEISTTNSECSKRNVAVGSGNAKVAEDGMDSPSASEEDFPKGKSSRKKIRAYTAKSSLLRHEVVHNAVNRSQPRECRRCGETFENYDAFEKHDAVHRPFRCQRSSLLHVSGQEIPEIVVNSSYEAKAVFIICELFFFFDSKLISSRSVIFLGSTKISVPKSDLFRVPIGATIALLDPKATLEGCCACTLLRVKRTMAALPLSFHAARKVRETLARHPYAASSGLALDKPFMYAEQHADAPKMADVEPKSSSATVNEVPAHYSSKMMNSIWGLYNRDATFNYKTVRGDAPPSVTPLPSGTPIAPHQAETELGDRKILSLQNSLTVLEFIRSGDHLDVEKIGDGAGGVFWGCKKNCHTTPARPPARTAASLSPRRMIVVSTKRRDVTLMSLLSTVTHTLTRSLSLPVGTSLGTMETHHPSFLTPQASFQGISALEVDIEDEGR